MQHSVRTKVSIMGFFANWVTRADADTSVIVYMLGEIDSGRESE